MPKNSNKNWRSCKNPSSEFLPPRQIFFQTDKADTHTSLSLHYSIKSIPIFTNMLLIHYCLSQKYELSKQQASVLLCMSVFNLWKVNCVVLAAEGRKAITVISHSHRGAFCVYRDAVYLHRLEITPFIVAVMSKEWHHYDYRIKTDCSW